MAETVFRKKSLDRISSPEHLDDYIRVSSPSVWLILASIAALLIGACVWGVFGRMDTTVDAVVRVENGAAVCLLADEDASSVSVGMPVSMEGAEYTVTGVSKTAVQLEDSAADELGDYYLHLSGLTLGAWVRVVNLDAGVPDGIYPAKIILERMAPISFVLN